MLGRLLQEPHTDVHRHRIESAAMHDTCASLLRARLVLVDHLANPVNFAREIAVMGSGFDTSGDEV